MANTVLQCLSPQVQTLYSSVGRTPIPPEPLLGLCCFSIWKTLDTPEFRFGRTFFGMLVADSELNAGGTTQ